MSDLAGEPGFKSLSGSVAAHGEPHGSSIVCRDDCHVAGENSCLKPLDIVGGQRSAGARAANRGRARPGQASKRSGIDIVWCAVEESGR